MQIRREVAQALADVLVTTQQPVVADDRRNRGRETELFLETFYFPELMYYIPTKFAFNKCNILLQ